MVVLLSFRFSVAQNKTKGKVYFEDSRLFAEDVAELLTKGSWTDRRQTNNNKSVVAAKSGTNLWPVLPHLSNILISA